MKKIVFILVILFTGIAAGAQVNSSASQTINLNLSNAIEISFTGTGTTTGDAVSMAFITVDNYANGVESDPQELKVRSNKNFTVTIKSNSTNFTYTGTTTPAPTMPVAGVLGIMVTSNSTGGAIASPFSLISYSGITSSNQNLLTNGTRGGNQLFSIQYQATPGFLYPAGNYAVDVVYTATQN
jgi:hypothetical protein